MMTRSDKWLVGGTLLLLPWLYFALWGADTRGEQVQILVGGHEVARAPLSENRTLRITGPRGVSVITIADGRARFVSSPCPTKECIHSGWQSHGGETAVCLPNRVSLVIVGQDARYDSVVF